MNATEGFRTLHAFVAAIRHPAVAGYQILLADRSLEVLQEREIQRGTLEARNRPDGGAAFLLRLPLDGAEPEGADSESPDRRPTVENGSTSP